MEWVFELSNEEKSKLENDEIVETFEMILFNQAMGMVEDEDQKIYNLLPVYAAIGRCCR